MTTVYFMTKHNKSKVALRRKPFACYFLWSKCRVTF